jgi:hypothetical protein
MDINVLDHLILAGDKDYYYSFADEDSPRFVIFSICG